MECKHCGAVAPAGEDLCPDCGMSLRDESTTGPTRAPRETKAAGNAGLLVLTHGIALCLGILLGAWIGRSAMENAHRAGQAGGETLVPSMPGHPPVQSGAKAPPMSEVMRIMEERGMRPEDIEKLGGMGNMVSPHESPPQHSATEPAKESSNAP